MKRLIVLGLVVALTTALTAVTLAQTAGPKGGVQGGVRQDPKNQRALRMLRGKVMQEMFAKLDLSPEQKKKIEELNAKFKGELKDLRAAPGEQEAKKAKLRSLMEAHQKAVMDVLTPDQKAKLQELVAQARKKIQDRRGQKPPPDKKKTPPPA